jgi:hypothetical protein
LKVTATVNQLVLFILFATATALLFGTIMRELATPDVRG